MIGVNKKGYKKKFSLVKTDAEVGLTTKDVEKATAILLSDIR